MAVQRLRRAGRAGDAPGRLLPAIGMALVVACAGPRTGAFFAGAIPLLGTNAELPRASFAGYSGGYALSPSRVSLGAEPANLNGAMPLGNQVIVEEVGAPEETENGLLLLEGAKKRQSALRMGRVRALGPGQPGSKRDPAFLSQLNEGDMVLWDDYSNNKLNDNAKDDHVYLVAVTSIKAKVTA
eukprot:TRINITY_DN36519_c0_g1_i1.p1 TRINITY_DN36519_c0_g1~~TRINITY_DN36519_c0_g1_i1.p1  ORF type:complete len:205 (-),score=25.64 TRINITY_DN36519_c0_g1_i1:83-634(-)